MERASSWDGAALLFTLGLVRSTVEGWEGSNAVVASAISSKTFSRCERWFAQCASCATRSCVGVCKSSSSSLVKETSALESGYRTVGWKRTSSGRKLFSSTKLAPKQVFAMIARTAPRM